MVKNILIESTNNEVPLSEMLKNVDIQTLNYKEHSYLIVCQDQGSYSKITEDLKLLLVNDVDKFDKTSSITVTTVDFINISSKFNNFFRSLNLSKKYTVIVEELNSVAANFLSLATTLLHNSNGGSVDVEFKVYVNNKWDSKNIIGVMNKISTPDIVKRDDTVARDYDKIIDELSRDLANVKNTVNQMLNGQDLRSGSRALYNIPLGAYDNGFNTYRFPLDRINGHVSPLDNFSMHNSMHDGVSGRFGTKPIFSRNIDEVVNYLFNKKGAVGLNIGMLVLGGLANFNKDHPLFSLTEFIDVKIPDTLKNNVGASVMIPHTDLILLSHTILAAAKQSSVNPSETFTSDIYKDCFLVNLPAHYHPYAGAITAILRMLVNTESGTEYRITFDLCFLD